MIVEVCDICKKETSETDGIYVRASDFNGLCFGGGMPMRTRRKYKMHICQKCVEAIKKYCNEINI